MCGFTRLEDALHAEGLGVDFLGFILAPSKRQLPSLEALRALAGGLSGRAKRVAVVANLPLDRCREIAEAVDVLQLHGDEPPDFVHQLSGEIFKAVNVERISPSELEDFLAMPSLKLLCDSGTPTNRGGTGKLANWERIAALPEVSQRVILAGGLTPLNVSEAIAAVQPWSVDVSSGIENSPGIKSPHLMERFYHEATRQPA